MRITPNHPRLRATAIACMSIGAWALLQAGQIAAAGHSILLTLALSIAAILCLALGIAFWLLGTDRRAGVIFDSKGLMLNLGQSAAFVSWQNIADIGLIRRRSSWLALGSRDQIGIQLSDPSEYLQSYEARIPASRGILAQGVRLIANTLYCGRHTAHAPTAREIEGLRQRTGYDLIIPETLIGGRSSAFIEMVDAFRHNPYRRRMFQIREAARSMS